MKKIILTIFLIFCSLINAAEINEKEFVRINIKSDVLLQGYYWNTTPDGIWWDSLSTLSAGLASAMFDGIWIPSPSKGASGKFSMGYDIYDHYDFGNYYQRGTQETRFGSLKELQKMIDRYHSLKMKVYSDVVLNWVTGGEELQQYECSPEDYQDSSYLVFKYPNGSKRFKKDASFFYPNKGNCSDEYFDRKISKIQEQKLEWLAFNRSYVRDSLIAYGKYLADNLRIDGFRLFEANYLDLEFVLDWADAFKETDNYSIVDYTGDKKYYDLILKNKDVINNSNLLIPDYQIRDVLVDFCENTDGNFNLSVFDDLGFINKGINPNNVLHLLETSEFDKTNWQNIKEKGDMSIKGDKKAAYAYILFSEGKPSIFFRDYYINGLKDYLDLLVLARAKYIRGKTYNRFDINAFVIRDDKKQSQSLLAKDLYIAYRSDKEDGTGSYLLINDDRRHSMVVYADTHLPIGHKISNILNENAFAEVIKPTVNSVQNRIKFTIAPNTCAIFLTDSLLQFNNPPVLAKVNNLTAFSDSKFYYKLLFNDANNDYVTFNLKKAPKWLTLSSKGELMGMPTSKDLGTSEVIIELYDIYTAAVADTFKITVALNSAPVFSSISDKRTSVGKRFETTVSADDVDNDSLNYSFISAPSWLKLGEYTGLLSGTPSIQDTGNFNIAIQVTDNKGCFDSLHFDISVNLDKQSLLGTFYKPKIDGIVEGSDSDWSDDLLLVSDDEEDAKRNFELTVDDDIYNLYATWDSDSLYFGAEYQLDENDNFLIYIDAGLAGGITNFYRRDNYAGDYPYNIRFDQKSNIDFLFVQNANENYNFFECFDQKTHTLKSKVNCIVNPSRQSMELAVSWDDIYGNGAGKIPENVQLKVVAVIAGEQNTGAIDTAPDNLNVNGSDGPDSIIDLVSINPDKNGDGMPDPTVVISQSEINNAIISTGDYKLLQNYPNPFNPITYISFEIPVGGLVQLKVYDVLGREVATLVNKELKAGKYSYSFNAENLSSGTYFYRIKSRDFVEVRKMIYIK